MASTPAPSGFELQDFLPYRLSVVTNRISRAFARRYSEAFGLTIPEWRVMAVLGSYAPLSATGLAERTAMDKVKVSRAVAGLKAAGHVTAASDPDDGRAMQLSLTKRGRATYEAIVPLARQIEAELTGALSLQDRSVLICALDRLGACLDGLEERDSAMLKQ